MVMLNRPYGDRVSMEIPMRVLISDCLLSDEWMIIDKGSQIYCRITKSSWPSYSNSYYAPGKEHTKLMFPFRIKYSLKFGYFVFIRWRIRGVMGMDVRGPLVIVSPVPVRLNIWLQGIWATILTRTTLLWLRICLVDRRRTNAVPGRDLFIDVTGRRQFGGIPLTSNSNKDMFHDV